MEKQPKSNMYKGAKIWSPFVGCEFHCAYCKPSFQSQIKRYGNAIGPNGKRKCGRCGDYIPHEHLERLYKIPSIKKPNEYGERIVFVAGNGDLSFCKNRAYIREIIRAIKEHNERAKTKKAYYFQSKDPIYFRPFLKEFPDNVKLVTTLETNRDEGYSKVSLAPKPSKRYKDFLSLDYPHKVVTIEPIMDFDVDIFSEWITNIAPEYIWLGFNSKPSKKVKMDEPSDEKVIEFIDALKSINSSIRIRTHNQRAKKIGIRYKNMRGIKI